MYTQQVQQNKQEIKTVQKEWLGKTKDNNDSNERIVVKECSCLFD